MWSNTAGACQRKQLQTFPKQLLSRSENRSRIPQAIRYIWRTASRSLLSASGFLIFLSATHRFSTLSPVRRAERASHSSWSGIRSRNRHPPTPRKPWRYILLTKTTSPIVGYAKTRDTYVAYRKAGYSKKFLAEHESEITIHKAAKNYFDGLGFKKLPTIKALNTEYAELLAEKKAAYADYRKAREEMKELLTAKANIDRILELDKEQEEANERREKEAEQR